MRDVLIDVVTEVSASGFYSKDIQETDKKFIGTIGVIRDITERKRSVEALRRSEEKLKGMLDAISDYICMMDKNLNIIWANETFKKTFGNNVISKKCYEVFHKSKKPCKTPLCPAKKAFKDGKVHESEHVFRVQNIDGDELYIQSTSNVSLRENDGKPAAVVYIARDVTEIRKAEEAKRESQEFAGNIIDSSVDMIIATDKNRKIIEFNRAAEETFGYKNIEIKGADIQVLYADVEKGKELYDEVLRKGHIRQEMFYKRKNGVVFPVMLSSSVLLNTKGDLVGVMEISRDITELKKMEKELLKAHKLESIGVFAGGIAHDFNNILTAILGNVSLAMFTDDAQEVKIRLRETENAAIRAKDLTQQLLTFSKGGAPIKKTASIIELIRDSANFASRGSDVKCEFEISNDLYPVDVDEGQMSQVINNLVINAIQAMPGSGRIWIIGENIDLDENKLPPLKKGRYIKITVKDRGIGIQEEFLSRIFEPYFTTKQKGNGLGLATSYSIIKNHGGLINVESTFRVGTTFHIYLPVSSNIAEKKQHKGKQLLFGEGRILIMDDDDAIRLILGKMLNQLGYEVEYAKDGSEAIMYYKKSLKSGKPFDAVIMDLTIPGGMGGKVCIRELLSIDSGARVIVSSGYSNDPVIGNYRQIGFCGYVAKPYRLEDLSKVINDVLNKPNKKT